MLFRLKTLATVAVFAATAATTGAAIAGPLKNSSPAPEFTGIEKWLNSEQLTMQQLRGKVAQDNRYATWSAYNNQYWPALYLIDKKGQVVYTHFGEGQYAQTEAAIKALLAQKE